MSNKTISKNKKTFIITTLTIQCCISMLRAEDSASLNHELRHDEFMKGKKTQKINAGPLRVLTDNSGSDLQWRKMRIKFDWSRVDFSYAFSPRPTEKIDYMKEILGTVQNYFETRIDVHSRQVLDLTGKTECRNRIKIPSILQTKHETDLLIMIATFTSRDNGFLINIRPACLEDEVQGRPVVNMIQLDFNNIDPTEEKNQHYYTLVFIRQMLKVLGFDHQYMDRKKLLSEIDIAGRTRWAVTSPKVVEQAKSYFGCDSIQGVPMNRSYLSWDSFPSDIMNHRVAYSSTISEFTIKLLEDLGWYRGDQAHQRNVYLKGEGCGIFDSNNKAKKIPDEFCTVDDEVDEDHCQPNKLAKSRCIRYPAYRGGGNILVPSANSLCTSDNVGNSKAFDFESYGAHSRCIQAEKNNTFKAACLRMRCNKTDKIIEVQIGSDVINCEEEGEIDVTTTAYNGKLKCPNYNEMCEEVQDHRCPMDCYGRGQCMANQTCQCFSGFSGTYCNKGLPKENNTFVTDYDIRNDENFKEEVYVDKKNKGHKTLYPKVIGLEKRITKFETSYDQLSLEKKKVDFEIAINDLCLKESPKPESCVKSQNTNLKRQKELEVDINDLSDKINITTEDINRLLTDDQKKQRDEWVVDKALERNTILQELMREYLEDYYKKELQDKKKYNDLINLYRPYETDRPASFFLKKHLTKPIAYYENLVNRIDENIKLIEKTWKENSNTTAAPSTEMSEDLSESIEHRN